MKIILILVKMLPVLEKNENIEKEINVLLLFEKWNILIKCTYARHNIYLKKTALPTCLALKNCVNL